MALVNQTPNEKEMLSAETAGSDAAVQTNGRHVNGAFKTEHRDVIKEMDGL